MILCDKCQSEAYAPKDTITGPLDCLPLFADLREKEAEWVQVAFLDARNRVLAVETVAIGGLRASVIQPRDIFAAALKYPTASMILAHNHPSGDPTPSREDSDVTRQLVEACKVMGLELLDHLVVTRNGFCSMREKGML